MKKGQFTVMAVLGVIALIAIVALLFFRGQTDEGRVERGTDVASSTKTSLQNFVETCLFEVARHGLTLVGESGGYIDTGDYDIIEGLGPTDQDSLEFSPGSEVILPYWHYQKSSNDCTENCVFDSEAPYLKHTSDSIEGQLEAYIDANVEACFNDFENFLDYGEIRNLDSPRSSVTFTSDAVLVDLEYPIEARKGGSLVSFEDYQTTLDVSFERIYDTAYFLTQYLVNSNFMEEFISKGILGTHSMGQKPEIPPMGGGVEFDNMGPWVLEDVEGLLKAYLNDEISKMSVEGTANGKIVLTESVIDNSQNRNLVLPATGTLYSAIDNSDLEINFDYIPWWDIYLDITGEGTGGPVIVSSSFWMPGLGGIFPSLKLVNFAYDLSYPVIVTVNQPNAFSGEGYTFMFALETNLRNNEPLDTNFSARMLTGENTGTFLCDPAQKNSGMIKVNVQDAITKQGISGATVRFTCGTETCHMGETDDIGIYSGNFPLCVNGEVKATIPGYGQGIGSLSPKTDKDETVVLRAMPEFSVEASIKKKMIQIISEGSDPLEESSWQFPTGIETLKINEEASIILTNVDDPSYVRTVSFDGSLVPMEIDLIPGTYEVSGYVSADMEDDPVVIPAVVIQGETLPKVVLNQTVLLGGVTLDENQEHIRIRISDLASGKIVFYVAAIDPHQISKHVDMAIFDKYEEVSQTYPAEFKPAFS